MSFIIFRNVVLLTSGCQGFWTINVWINEICDNINTSLVDIVTFMCFFTVSGIKQTNISPLDVLH